MVRLGGRLATLLLILFLGCYLYMFIASDLSPEVYIYVTNDIERGTTVKLHCQSEDDSGYDHGEQVRLGYEEDFGWSFRPSFFGKTVFRCSIDSVYARSKSSSVSWYKKSLDSYGNAVGTTGRRRRNVAVGGAVKQGTDDHSSDMLFKYYTMISNPMAMIFLMIILVVTSEFVWKYFEEPEMEPARGGARNRARGEHCPAQNF